MKAAAKSNIEIVADYEALALRSFELFLSDAQKAINERGVFYVAVSGGHTPRSFFKLLGEDEKSKSLSWDKIHLFWVDERMVPPDSEWSNYKLAADTFLDKVGIPKENVHRIPTEYGNFDMAVNEYIEVIQNVLGSGKDKMPEFDLIILGMGSDGHLGSLFPNSYAPFDTEDLACVVYCLDEKLDRITLTPPILRAGRHLIVLVSGEAKADILKEVLNSEPDEVLYPIHILWPVLNKVSWIADSQAAKLL